MNRETGLHFVKAFAVELAFDVGRSFRLNAVDRLVNNAETDFGVGCGRAVFVARDDCVRSHVARLEFFLVRNDVELQHLVARGHGDQLTLVVHVAVFDERHVQVHVRFILPINRHVDHDAATGRIDLPHGDDA